MPKIEEIWIMNRDGINLLHCIDGDKKGASEALVTGFLSAIQTLITTNVDQELKSIKFQKEKLVIYKPTESELFYVVGRTGKKEKDFLIKLELRKVAKLFHSEFSDRLENYNGEISCYETIQEKVKKIME